MALVFLGGLINYQGSPSISPKSPAIWAIWAILAVRWLLGSQDTHVPLLAVFVDEKSPRYLKFRHGWLQFLLPGLGVGLKSLCWVRGKIQRRLIWSEHLVS